MSEEEKVSSLITYLYETMNGELALDYAELDSENIELLLKELERKDKEIERLNNIINEFNKLIENEINESKLEEDYDRVDAMEYCLATLQELKVDDK